MAGGGIEMESPRRSRKSIETSPILGSRDAPPGGGSQTGNESSTTIPWDTPSPTPGSPPSGGGSRPPSYTWELVEKDYIHVDDSLKASLHFLCGVPAWTSDQGSELHFGEIPLSSSDDNGDSSDWGKYLPPEKANESSEDRGRRLFNDRFVFFNYDPTQEGAADFSFPFYNSSASDYYGNLTNWWAGCESVCSTIQRIVSPDVDFSQQLPGKGFGYLFRKNVPRLVFVFTNEFDNEYKRTRYDDV
jgi:hypothetical protein